MENNNTINNRIPQLRFPGFTGEWQEKLLCSLATKVNQKNKDFAVTRMLTNSATEGVVDQNAYFEREIAVKDNTNNYCIVDKDDFVYNPRISSTAPVGPISINKVGKGIMSPLYTVFKFQQGHIAFFEQYFQTEIWHPYLKSIANFGARFDRMNITTDGFFNMPLFVPSIEEQQKIAECLETLDNLIAAETKKLEFLKAHKKGLMQQLFPQPGATTPALRFPGYSGEWEEKTLGEVATSFSGGTPKSGEPRFYGGSIPFIRSGEIHGNKTELFITEDGLKNSSAKLVKKGDLLFALYGATSGEVDLSKIEGAINQAILCIRSEVIDTCFLYNYLSHRKDYITSHFLQGGQGNLSSDIIMSLAIPFPPFAEQQKVASCLTEMDNIISAQEQKVEFLKAHKKGLMQQLFPQPEK